MISRAAGTRIPRPHGSLLTPVALQKPRMSRLPDGSARASWKTTSCSDAIAVKTVARPRGGATVRRLLLARPAQTSKQSVLLLS